MLEIDDTNPKERLKDAVSSPYDVEDSDLEALLNAIGNQFEDFERERENVLNAKFVDDATGEQLEKLAEFVQLSSRRNESTSEFRQRIKANIRSKLASGTYDEVEELVGVLLGVDPSLLDTREFYNNDSPSFVVRLPVDDVGEKDLNTRALRPLINDVSAVGVNGTATLVTDIGDIHIVGGSVNVAEMFESRDASLVIDATFEFEEMFESPDALVQVDPDDTADELLYAGLSSDTLNPLSGDSYRGIEVTATDLPTATEIIATEDVTNVRIGASSTEVSFVAETVSPQTTNDAGLSADKLNRLSKDGWT